MAHRITLIPRDGSGPEITEATLRVLQATDIQFDRHVKPAGIGFAERYGSLPPGVAESVPKGYMAIEGRTSEGACLPPTMTGRPGDRLGAKRVSRERE